MPFPLMPKATAIWLVENTALTFEQIARFCGMHELEVQAIADGDSGSKLVGVSPVVAGQLTQENIDACEKNPSAVLELIESKASPIAGRTKVKYTPIAQRQDRPDGIAWILKHHPEVTDAQICRLLRTTKHTIDAIRHKTHWNISQINTRNPITLGLCSEPDLQKIVALSERRRALAEKKAARLAKRKGASS